MKKYMLAALCGFSLLTVAPGEAATGGDEPPVEALSTIPVLDVPRYMGTWYEIAKYPNWFQRKCTSATSAEYRLNKDGTVQVINRCRIASGEGIEAIGAARQIGLATSARLKVSFAPGWLSWLPLVWGDYWVIDLDERYQLVAVSEPGREFLWILARERRVAPIEYQNLLARLQKKGFDLRKLELSSQEMQGGQ